MSRTTQGPLVTIGGVVDPDHTCRVLGSGSGDGTGDVEVSPDSQRPGEEAT